MTSLTAGTCVEAKVISIEYLLFSKFVRTLVMLLLILLSCFAYRKSKVFIHVTSHKHIQFINN